MHILSKYGKAIDARFFMTVPLQHFLAFFLPNDAARVRDIRVSYVASLISAYAKLSNPPPTPSLSLYAGDLCFMANTSYIHFLWQP